MKLLHSVWDSTFDKSMAKLYSYAMLKKLAEGIEERKAVGLIRDICALASSFCMMPLHLHAVKGSFVPAKHRALYLFSLIPLFYSMSGFCMKAKQNMVSQTVGILFLILHKNVNAPFTSELSEQTFGYMRMAD